MLLVLSVREFAMPNSNRRGLWVHPLTVTIRDICNNGRCHTITAAELETYPQYDDAVVA